MGCIVPGISEVQAGYYRHGWWRAETFLDDLRHHVAAAPDQPVLKAHRRGATRVIGYAELAALTEDFAAKLIGLGVQPGEVVAVQLPNWWELLQMGLACARIGAIFCPLMAIYRRRELEFILRLTGARICVTLAEWGGVRLGEVVADLRRELPGLEHVFVAGGAGPSGAASFEQDFVAATAAPDVLAGRAESGPDDPFLMLFTSGTTGESKGVLHSQNTLYASSSAYAEALKLDSTSVTFVCHAATHYSGFVTGILVPLMLGATAAITESWNAAHYLELSPGWHVTLFYGAPNFLLDLLSAQRETGADLSDLRHVVTGSAPIPPPVIQKVRAGLGVTIVALWGMTENGAVTITRPDDSADWAEHSDGSPLGGMEVRIDTAAVPGGSDGSGAMLVRGPSQCLGYYKRDALYAESVDGDGWFDTGDLARDDGRGGVRITGRVKDVVMHHSLNVPVGEVENALLRHPQVRDVAVIGVPGEADEITCAVVVPNGRPPTLDSIRGYLAGAGFSEWFWPGQIEYLDTLPRTITGKVRKVDLRQQFGAG
jgi:cyclohexanecarboxylate-CoA ligase